MSRHNQNRRLAHLAKRQGGLPLPHDTVTSKGSPPTSAPAPPSKTPPAPPTTHSTVEHTTAAPPPTSKPAPPGTTSKPPAPKPPPPSTTSKQEQQPPSSNNPPPPPPTTTSPSSSDVPTSVVISSTSDILAVPSTTPLDPYPTTATDIMPQPIYTPPVYSTTNSGLSTSIIDGDSPTSTPDPSGGSSNSNVGGIAGIVVGVLLGLGVVGLAIGFIRRRMKYRNGGDDRDDFIRHSVMLKDDNNPNYGSRNALALARANAYNQDDSVQMSQTANNTGAGAYQQQYNMGGNNNNSHRSQEYDDYAPQSSYPYAHADYAQNQHADYAQQQHADYAHDQYDQHQHQQHDQGQYDYVDEYAQPQHAQQQQQPQHPYAELSRQLDRPHDSPTSVSHSPPPMGAGGIGRTGTPEDPNPQQMYMRGGQGGGYYGQGQNQ